MKAVIDLKKLGDKPEIKFVSDDKTESVMVVDDVLLVNDDMFEGRTTIRGRELLYHYRASRKMEKILNLFNDLTEKVKKEAQF